MNDAHRAILRLMNDYCYRIDAGDLAGFADLFRHGTWRRAQDDPAADAAGAAAVREALDSVILYDGKPRTKHVMSNVQIDVQAGGERARAQCYILVFQAVPPDFPLQPIFAGHYHDEFERVDGTWRFLLRAIAPDLVGDLSRHLAQVPAALEH